MENKNIYFKLIEKPTPKIEKMDFVDSITNGVCCDVQTYETGNGKTIMIYIKLVCSYDHNQYINQIKYHTLSKIKDSDLINEYTNLAYLELENMAQLIHERTGLFFGLYLKENLERQLYEKFNAINEN